jgi:dipeptidyl aminopeptidase/acylaminoacyl peptidase
MTEAKIPQVPSVKRENRRATGCADGTIPSRDLSLRPGDAFRTGTNLFRRDERNRVVSPNNQHLRDATACNAESDGFKLVYPHFRREAIPVGLFDHKRYAAFLRAIAIDNGQPRLDGARKILESFAIVVLKKHHRIRNTEHSEQTAQDEGTRTTGTAGTNELGFGGLAPISSNVGEHFQGLGCGCEVGAHAERVLERKFGTGSIAGCLMHLAQIKEWNWIRAIQFRCVLQMVQPQLLPLRLVRKIVTPGVPTQKRVHFGVVGTKCQRLGHHLCRFLPVPLRFRDLGLREQLCRSGISRQGGHWNNCISASIACGAVDGDGVSIETRARSGDAPSMSTTELPFGSWPSTLSATALATGGLRLGACQVVRDTDIGPIIYWIEGRPSEGGWMALCRCLPNGTISTVTPEPFNVRTRVHEYGGGAFAVQGESIYFIDFRTQRLFVIDNDRPARAITAEQEPWRLADLIVDRQHDRILCVGERTLQTDSVENHLVEVSLSTGAIRPVVSGADFYATPRLSPDGHHLCWLSWNHPHMPWDTAALYLAPVDPRGIVGQAQHISGGQTETATSSVFQPGWLSDGRMVFADDRTGFWNLYCASPEEQPKPLTSQTAEFGLPLWQFGMATWAELDSQHIATLFTRDGLWFLATIDLSSNALTTLPIGITAASHLHAADGTIALVGGSPSMPNSVLCLMAGATEPTVVRSSLATEMMACLVGQLSLPESIDFQTSDGDNAHAIFYPPVHNGFAGIAGEKPPLIVMAHGGPTAATAAQNNPSVLFWTSRGFAVVDVNYRGSTGYGRAYRERLDFHWGIRDVQDCVHAAQHLADTGRVDGKRMAIRGSSAGGFTVLCALAFHKTFAAGATSYGVSDLSALARDTHKFEARYLDRLVGPYPERADLYHKRSPLFAAAQITSPTLFFQGLDDKVVPPSQTESMVEALRKGAVPTAYLAFEGEQHGFRRAQTIERVLLAELTFYGKIFRFTPADGYADLTIENFHD